MIDTHVHLSIPPTPFNKGEKLKWIILSASDIQDSKDNLELAKKNKKLLPAVGIHPQNLITNYELQITNLEELLKIIKILWRLGNADWSLPMALTKKNKSNCLKNRLNWRLNIINH